MVKNFLLVAAIACFASCSSLKPLNFTSNKQVINATPDSRQATPSRTHNNQVKFIDNISVTPPASNNPKIVPPAGGDKLEKKETFNTRGLNIEETAAPTLTVYGDRSAVVEMASPIQLKYAILLNTEVEQLQNKALLESVDEWYGTRYRLGGTTKSGIDCSAFVQASFLAAFGITLPRTAREQYKATKRISRTDLKEGDLVFFNTRGGVSHVGIYLQNNKFIHASTSQGVVVSDMFDAYYLKRYVGAGRMATEMSSSR
jgi:hypothetical protein